MANQIAQNMSDSEKDSIEGMDMEKMIGHVTKNVFKMMGNTSPGGGGMPDIGSLFSSLVNKESGTSQVEIEEVPFLKTRDICFELNVDLEDFYTGKKKKLNVKRKRIIEVDGKQKVVEEKKKLIIPIDRGMKDEQQIRFEGEADQIPGYLPGDIIITLVENEHSLFQRDNDNLIIIKNINLYQNYDIQFDIKHLDGRTIRIVNHDPEALHLNDGLRSLKSDSNINNTNNFNNIKLIDSLSKSIELLIKLILVKLSKNFNSLCNISSKEADMHSILVSNLIEIYCNSYMIILFINKLKINSLNPLTSQEDELKSEFIYTNLSDGPSSDDEELEKNGLEQLFDLKNILMKIKTIFSLDSNNPDSENYNIFNVGKIFIRIDTKNINRKFIEFIKKEIAKNFKYFNDNNFSQSLISIWQSSYNNIVSNHNHNYDNDLIRKNFPQKNEQCTSYKIHSFKGRDLIF